jgi:hypothetical protein
MGDSFSKQEPEGVGPGRFGEPNRVIYDSAADRIVVLDALNLRASACRLRDTLIFETSYRMPLRAEDACFMGTRLYVLSFYAGHLLHQMSVEGGELRIIHSSGVSRGNTPLDSQEMYQNQLVRGGQLLCHASLNLIFAVSGYGSVAQVFDATSLAQRTVRLDSLRPLQFGLQSNGGQTMLSQGIGPDGVDWVRAVQPGGSNVRILADHVAPGTRNQNFSTVTEWFLAADGTIRRGATTRQREVGRNGTSVACFVSSPVSVIEIHRAARCP